MRSLHIFFFESSAFVLILQCTVPISHLSSAIHIYILCGCNVRISGWHNQIPLCFASHRAKMFTKLQTWRKIAFSQICASNISDTQTAKQLQQTHFYCMIMTFSCGCLNWVENKCIPFYYYYGICVNVCARYESSYMAVDELPECV